METHKQAADRLGVSVTAVAILREVRAGTSAQSQRALRETADNHIVAAAVWLATFRGCHAVSNEITMRLLKELKEVEDG